MDCDAGNGKVARQPWQPHVMLRSHVPWPIDAVNAHLSMRSHMRPMQHVHCHSWSLAPAHLGMRIPWESH